MPRNILVEQNPFNKKILLTRQQRRDILGYSFISVSLIIFILFTLIPIVLALSFSFANAKNFNVNLDELDWVGFRNFRYIFKTDKNFWIGMKNILIYAVVTVPLTLTGSMILALIVKKPIKGTKIFRGLFYLPGITSGAAIAMVWLSMLSSNGIVNQMITGLNNLFGSTIPTISINDSRTSLWGLILMCLWGALGGNMVLYLASMNSIPSSIYEAADIDGAGRIRKFFSITLPLMKPSIIFSLTLSIIGTLQMYENIILMGASTTTPVYEIYKNGFGQGLTMSIATSQSLILFVVIMISSGTVRLVGKERD